MTWIIFLTEINLKLSQMKKIFQVLNSIPWVRCASGNVWSNYHHWMFFGSLTMAMANNWHQQLYFNGFWSCSCHQRFQWFSMVLDRWSNDAMVSMDRHGLCKPKVKSKNASWSMPIPMQWRHQHPRACIECGSAHSATLPLCTTGAVHFLVTENVQYMTTLYLCTDQQHAGAQQHRPIVTLLVDH